MVKFISQYKERKTDRQTHANKPQNFFCFSHVKFGYFANFCVPSNHKTEVSAGIKKKNGSVVWIFTIHPQDGSKNSTLQAKFALVVVFWKCAYYTTQISLPVLLFLLSACPMKTTSSLWHCTFAWWPQQQLCIGQAYLWWD